MKKGFFFLMLLASAAFTSNVNASRQKFEPSAALMGFLNSIKAAGVSPAATSEKFRALPHEEQMKLCLEVMDPGFPDLTGSLSIGTFKRNALTNYCQTLEPEKLSKDIGKIQEHQVPRLKDYELQHQEVGKIKTPPVTEAASSSGPSSQPRVIKKIVIPEHLLVDDKKSQADALARVQEALAEVERQSSREDHAMQEKIKEIQNSMKTAHEDYDSMSAIVAALREDVSDMNKMHGLFSRFNPGSHAHDTHEQYLESILLQEADLRQAQPYNRGGELDQLNLAKQKLEESKQNLQKAQAELRAIAG